MVGELQLEAGGVVEPVDDLVAAATEGIDVDRRERERGWSRLADPGTIRAGGQTTPGTARAVSSMPTTMMTTADSAGATANARAVIPRGRQFAVRPRA